MLLNNPLLNTDAYKTGHWLHYPKNSKFTTSYLEARGGRWDIHQFFGLQFLLKNFMSTQITEGNIEEAKNFWNKRGEFFNDKDWYYIVKKYNGYFPVEIESIPEGTVLPTNNVLLQITNTDPRLYWLPAWLESTITRQLWYPITVATFSFICKQILKEYSEKSSEYGLDLLSLKLHCFGARGTSSFESVYLAGAANFINFDGTDPVQGTAAIIDYYHGSLDGITVPANEHNSVITWTNEEEYTKNIISIYENTNEYNLGGALVIDTYDQDNFIDNILGNSLFNQVKNFKKTLFIRPDSGDPAKNAPYIIKKLMNIFGYVKNSKGYYTLPKFLSVFYGDGIGENKLKEIIEALDKNKLSIDNISFGMGEKMTQGFSRETLGFVMKLNSITIDEKTYDIGKNTKNKESKKGKLALIKKNGSFFTINAKNCNKKDNYLSLVYKNGKILKDYTIDEIKITSHKYLLET